MIKTREQRLEYSREYNRKRGEEYPGYALYYIPEEHYIGITNNVYTRMNKHKHLGKIIDGWEVIQCYDNPIEAHFHETLFHLIGYNGYRP